ncbi:MAG: ABC transporter substrate-binding protein, partial [Dehalococcoidia bacterium]
NQIDDMAEGFTDVKQAESVAQDLGNKIQTMTFPSVSGMALMVNIHRDPWKDIRVREAIYRAIQPQRVMDTVFFSDARHTWYFSDARFTRFPLGWNAVKQYVDYDPKKAADLLRAAGIDSNHTYEFVAPAEAQTWIDSFGLIAEDLAKVGLKTRVNPVIRNIELQRLGPKPGDFDIGNSVLLDYSYAQTNSGTYWNCSSLEDPEIDAIVTKIRETLDTNQRRQLSNQFEMMLAQKYSNLIPVLSTDAHIGWYSYMKGVDFGIPSRWQLYQLDRWIDKA